MSRSEKVKTGSFLDKFGLGGTGRVKKGSGLSRPHSESDFNELDEMQPPAPLTDKEVEEQIRKMLDDMNLTEEKRKPLLDQTIEKKRQLLLMREKGYSTGPKSKLDTPTDYINALQKSNFENMSGHKISNLIESLRITLANNPVSWVKGFGSKGLDLVLHLLNECYSFNSRSGMGEHRAKIQLECLRSIRYFMNNTVGLKQAFDQKEVFALVARSLDPQSSDQPVMQEAAKVLGAVCLLSDQGGHERVLEAITISAENKGCDRFVPIVQGLHQRDNDSLRVYCMQLINAIVNIPEDFEYRIFLRNEFMRAGLHGLIDEMKKEASGDFANQITIFIKHKEEDFEEFSEKFDCIHSEFDDPKECYELIQNLIAETPAEPLFLAILQHMLCIRDDNNIRSAYFKLIEECVAQIVLHRSGYDPDFRAKKFEIDVEALTGLVVEKLKAADEKRNDELNNKLEVALTQKQEADAQNEQLKKRNAELEEALKSGVVQKSDFALAHENVAIKLVPPGGRTGGPPPPPPPPFPGMGPPPPPPPPMMGGGPPPPPPPPGMGPPGMPPPPPFGMLGMGLPLAPMQKPAIVELPFGMKAKKKWNLDVPLKKANWETIAPQKLSEKSFWVKVEEEKLASEEILEGLMRFSTKAPPKSLKEENDKNNSIGGKKLKELRVLDSKAAQNLAILLGGSLKHMSFEAVKVAILRCDETVLSGNVLEQLINYLPPADQLKRLEELQSQYVDLNDAEQFAVTISSIKRLVPRLRSMKFKAQYVDNVQDIKPGIVSATAACEEIKSSMKLAKLLELVLLVGNVMNSGSRNGQAVGFEISYLPKLSGTKDVENRQTLLHYLVETVEAKFPDILSFDEELIHLDKAARVSVETIQKSLRVMDSDLKNLETDLKNSKIPQGSDDKFFEIMSCFSKEARQQCDILQQMFSKIDSLYSDLAEYFTFDKSKYSVEEFFGDIKMFKDQFQQAYKDNVKLRETEEKIRRAKEAKAKAEIEKQERLARKKALVDINSNDDTGVMDNLLEALKTGQAFHRPDQKRKRAPRGAASGDNRAQLHRSRSRSNIMVLSPSSRELISEISMDNGDLKSTRSHGRRSSRGEEQTEDLLRRLREL